MTRRGFLSALSAALITSALLVRGLAQRAVNLQVDAQQIVGRCDPTLWGNIGYDPIYRLTVAPESQPVWVFIKQSGAFRYIRCHNALSDGFPGQTDAETYGCRIYSEGTDGQPRYTWTYLDRVLDTWVGAGLKPIFEMDFMPDALAEGKIVRNYSGGAINTPKDYNKWRDLCYETVRHCIARYGADEVRSWYFEIWNEPDLKTYFIDGLGPGERFTPDRVVRLNKMYDYFVDGAVAADERVQVGGPGIAGNADFLRAFLNHCVKETNHRTGAKGTRIDFISWHGYGTSDQIQKKNREMRRLVMQEFPALADREMQQNEWGQRLGQDANRPSVFTQYEAAFLCKSLDGIFSDEGAAVAKILRWGNPTGTTQPSRNRGWRPLTMRWGDNVVKLSIFNVYELLSKMGPERLLFTGSAYGDLVHGFATRRSDKDIQVLIYHFDERNEQSMGTAMPVSLTIQNLGGASPYRVTHYRIDQEHSNAAAAWVGLGSPANPTAVQLQQIQERSELQTMGSPALLTTEAGQLALSLTMPVNSISLITLEVTA